MHPEKNLDSQIAGLRILHKILEGYVIHSYLRMQPESLKYKNL